MSDAGDTAVDDTTDDVTDDAAGASAEVAPDTERVVAVVGYIVRGIVDQPDAVKVSVDLDHPRARVNVEVGPGDMGRVIGKRGRVANAIRAIGRAAAARDGVEVDVEFVD